MTDIRTLQIEPDKFYHIYNRGVNGNVIFKTESNYHFFLKKISEKLLSVCDIYAYSLLPNHFHLLVKIKSEEWLNSLVKVSNLDKAGLVNEKGLHSPQNHAIVDDFKNYKYSSYLTFLDESETFLKRNETLDLFDGKENFVFCHRKEPDLEDFD